MAETDGRKARGEASRSSMLTAAMTVVVSHGIQALTHRAVAEQLGIPHARVVYHFPTIVDLRKATLGQAGETMVAQLRALIAGNVDSFERSDPAQVPHIAAELATTLVTALHQETVSFFTLVAEATRIPELRSPVTSVTDQVAELLEPLSQDRGLARLAASAFLGLVMTTMASEPPCDLQVLRTQVKQLIEHFDPHREEKE
ncbi:MAG: TetR family transcriptional regulator [Propionibacteriaceae bacterium]|nr:TetR family transcriptional regulator [Propionibacteriaceae bacterium]